MSYYIRQSVLTIIWLIVALLLVMSLISYSANDPSWSHVSSVATDVSNLAGSGGAWLADILYAFLGAASWWLIVIACFEAWNVWRQAVQPNGLMRTLGYMFLMIATAGLTGVLSFGWLAQGMIGQIVGSGLSNLLTHWGTLLFLLVFIAITVTFTFDLHWREILSGDMIKNRLQSDTADDETASVTTQPDTAANTTALTKSAVNTAQLPLPLEANDTTKASHYLDDMADNVVSGSNPLDKFLDETGFSEIKEYEWLEENDATNPFKPVSSTYMANTKLTKRLDEQLQREIIKKPFEMPAPRQPRPVQANAQPSQPAQIPKDVPTVEVDAPVIPEPVTSRPVTAKPLISKADAIDGQPTSELHSEHDTFADLSMLAHQLDEYHATPLTLDDTHESDVSVPSVLEPVSQTADITALDDTPTEADLAEKPMPVATSLGMRQHPLNDESSATNNAVPADTQENPNISTNTTRVSNVIASPIPTSVIRPTQVDEKADTHELKPSIPTSSRSVESDQLDELAQASSSVSQPLDINNDALFSNQSRAMQTAAYRASLSPLPELSLLDLPDPDRKPSYSREQLQQLSELLEIKLQEFNIKAEVVNAQMGPVVTRFEVSLAPGLKASKVTGIAKDLARSLSMASVRVVEVIPGKPYIGIEVPNPQRQMVRLIELLKTDAYQDPEGLISMAMGKDIAGRPIIADLAKAPHMLVAGTTGSGKSVLVNSLLLSMLLKYTPSQLRLILIDPKQLELANYNDIPHLLTPVVTDMTEAASSLSWSVAEMERRYLLMSLFKVRKLDEFNKKVIAAEQSGQPLLDPLWRPNDSVSQDKPPKLKPLPQIVIVADEFADMIMQVGKQAEELITRLAQKSRAAGIHLILATQRPSVDVITGLIKANIPVRAALRVNSKVDSRTILDAGGAEDMLGHGDMLFLGPGQIEPNRVHGAFISDAEVNRVCDAWRERGAPDYIDNMFDNFELSSSSSGGGESSGGGASGDEDPLYDEVVAFLLETRKVSASSIQRKFSIGYNRAARIVDAMEEAGLVSGMTKSGKRELLM